MSKMNNKNTNNEEQVMDNLDFSSIPNEYICPISGFPMTEPVCIMSGHSYDKSSIEQWFKKSDKCPLTNKKYRVT